MKGYNIIMYIIEDDKNMSSPLFHDLVGLVHRRNTIPINILYHSYYFFGDYRIHIRGDKISLHKVGKVKLEHDTLKSDMQKFYNKYYMKGKKNILVYGGHEKHIYIDGFRNTNSTFFTGVKNLELLILDSCYSSTVSMLNSVIGGAQYVIACQSASPYRGFIGWDFLDILKSRKSDVSKYKEIIRSFIRRNNSSSKRMRRLNWRTDGVLIDMGKYKDLSEVLGEGYMFTKNKAARVEDVKRYNYYDLVTLSSGEKRLEDLVKGAVLYHKKTKLCKKYLNRKSKRLNGISIGLE